MQPFPAADPRSEEILSAYQQVVMDRLDEGLRAIQQSALQAMHEIAAEMWRTAGARGDDVQEQILGALSRDQAIRGLIAHSDERFQSLSVRVASIEDTLMAMSNATRELRTLLAQGAIGEGGVAAVGGADVEARIAELERHLEAAFQHLAERDRAMVEAVRDQVRREAERAAEDTAQRVERLEGHVEAGATSMIELVDRVKTEVGKLNEIAGREIDIDPSEIKRDLEDKLGRLAALVRSDSTRLAELIQQKSGPDTREFAQALDSRLGRMSELVSATTMAAVNEVARQVPEQAADALQERLEELTMSIDRSFVGLTDSIEAQLRRQGNAIVERTAETVDRQIADRLSSSVERLSTAAEQIERVNTGVGGIGEGVAADLGDLLDQRITALAKMIRSDNKAMAEYIQIAAEQQAAKQATRAVMELAASLPDRIMETMDRRFAEFAEALHRETQYTVEAVAKTADVVGNRMERVATAIGQQYDEDMGQIKRALGSGRTSA